MFIDFKQCSQLYKGKSTNKLLAFEILCIWSNHVVMEPMIIMVELDMVMVLRVGMMRIMMMIIQILIKMMMKKMMMLITMIKMLTITMNRLCR